MRKLWNQNDNLTTQHIVPMRRDANFGTIIDLMEIVFKMPLDILKWLMYSNALSIINIERGN